MRDSNSSFSKVEMDQEPSGDDLFLQPTIKNAQRILPFIGVIK